jgi:uncharacterized protein
MTTTNRPIPVPDERSAPFFEAAKEGRLLIKKCASCSSFLAPQREMCDTCTSENLEWAESSGRGTIYSYVFMHQLLHPAFRDEIPYNAIVVELEEGPRMTSNLVGTPDRDIRVGLPVEAVFEQVGEEVFVPKFRVVSG